MKLKLLPFLLFSIGCGENSLVDCDVPGNKPSQCVKKTPDERAIEALNAKDYGAAITELKALIEGEPKNYIRYSRLATAYAGRAGFQIANAFNSLGGGEENEGGQQSQGGGGGGVVDSMSSFIPAPEGDDYEAYEKKVDDMGLAKGTLAQIPDNLRSDESTEVYKTSVNFQLTIYSSAFSVMKISLFAVPSDEHGGNLDPDRLREMSDEDALEIMNSFADASEGEILSEDIEAMTDEINSGDGSAREKLIAYLEAEEEAE